MTTPDAGQRLIEDLREWQLLSQAKLRDRIEQAADEIERLRGVEADARRYRWLRSSDADWKPYIGCDSPTADQDSGVTILRDDEADEAIDAAIAASRSTGAADGGEEHGY